MGWRPESSFLGTAIQACRSKISDHSGAFSLSSGVEIAIRRGRRRRRCAMDLGFDCPSFVLKITRLSDARSSMSEADIFLSRESKIQLKEGEWFPGGLLGGGWSSGGANERPSWDREVDFIIANSRCRVQPPIVLQWQQGKPR